MAEIKFECPKCTRPMEGDEALRSEFVTCPDCDHQFFPVAKSIKHSTSASKPSIAGIAPRTHAQKLGDFAFKFTLASIFAVIAAFLVFLFHLSDSSSEARDSRSAYILCGSLIALALWLFLIAQVIYIRANTEK